ncbi:MAG: SulP family inorganic anion transporter [Puniceicoccales bacterium]
MSKLNGWIRKIGLDPFPIRKTLRDYSWTKFRADGKAAVNVALLDFPQGMAYALIAGLPVQMGIFCSSLASVFGPMLASSRFVMLGPTNATAVMLLSTFLTLGYGPAEAVLVMPMLLLLVSFFMIVGAVCRVAALTQYISRSVVVGYITAAACLIIVNQLKTVCGLHVPRAGTFAESLFIFLNHVGETHWQAVTVGAVTIGIYLALQKWAKGIPAVAATLVVVALGVSVAGPLGFSVEMLEGIDAAAWPLSIPRFSWNDFNEIANGALAITFLSLLESSSISKTLAAQAGDRIDLNQQMLSMGFANFVCSFGSGMTVSGSLTRSMLNYRSGAKTAISSILSGALLIGALFLLGGLIQYIPRPALAALVIMVGVSLIDRTTIRVMLKATKSDAAVFGATFVGGLFLPLDTAIYLGAGASMFFFIRRAARPELKEISITESGRIQEHELESRKRPAIAIVHVEGNLFFASSDLFLEQMRHIVEHPEQRAIILRLRNAYQLDATVALTIRQLIQFSRAHGCEILVSGARPEVERVFRDSGLMDVLGEDNFFHYHPENPNISTRDALKRAQKVTGIDSADITIFAAESKKEDQ